MASNQRGPDQSRLSKLFDNLTAGYHAAGMSSFPPPRPGLVTFSLAGLDPLEIQEARDAIALWDISTGASFAEVPEGAMLRFAAGQDFPSLVATVGVALGVPAAPGFAPRPEDLSMARALWGTPEAEQEIGFVWRWDPGLGALRLDSLSPHGRILSGTPGRDALFGGRGDDRLVGGAGNDILSGGGGRDLLFGGEGFDVALVPLLRGEAPLEFHWSRLSTPTGDITFDSVERLDLRDGDWILDATHAASRVDALYRALLGRPADGAGLVAATRAVEAGLSLPELGASILASEEYVRRFGPADAAARAVAEAADSLPGTAGPLWLPDAEAALLARLFHFGLARLPGREEARAWLDVLESGPVEEGVARFLSAHGLAADPRAFLAHSEALPSLAATDWLSAEGLRYAVWTSADVIM